VSLAQTPQSAINPDIWGYFESKNPAMVAFFLGTSGSMSKCPVGVSMQSSFPCLPTAIIARLAYEAKCTVCRANRPERAWCNQIILAQFEESNFTASDNRLKISGGLKRFGTTIKGPSIAVNFRICTDVYS
jgi:hypothetical protein